MKSININEQQLRQLVTTTASLAATIALRGAGLDKAQISKNEAFRRYSRKRVEAWIAKGLVKPIKNGKSVLLDTAELEGVSKVNHLVSDHFTEFSKK